MSCVLTTDGRFQRYVISFISGSNGYIIYLHKLPVFVVSDNSTDLYQSGNHGDYFCEDRGYPVFIKSVVRDRHCHPNEFVPDIWSFP